MPSQRGAVASLHRALGGPRPPFVLLASGCEAWRQQGVLDNVPPAQLLAAMVSPAMGIAAIPRLGSNAEWFRKRIRQSANCI